MRILLSIEVSSSAFSPAWQLALISQLIAAMPQGRRIVAEILTLSIPLSAKEATAIVRQLCGSVPAEAGEAAIARLAPEHVWLDRSGNVHLSPGVVASVADSGRCSSGFSPPCAVTNARISRLVLCFSPRLRPDGSIQRRLHRSRRWQPHWRVSTQRIRMRPFVRCSRQLTTS